MSKLCAKCGVREVEQIEDWVSHYCSRCNDELVERTSRQREWRHYHPGEPMPKSERLR